MKKIYLHIGCGKTGSSALQLWLNHNANFLEKNGLSYPLFGQKRLGEYDISSGNAAGVTNAIMEGKGEEFFTNLLRHINDNQDILLSSEAFQRLNNSQLIELKLLFTRLNLEPVIIAYVRDVYDMMYSSYLQLIKRHLYTNTFSNYAILCHSLQQFSVVRNWHSVFDNIKVIHYDTAKSQLDKSFLEAIDRTNLNVPAINENKVNRSLTLQEAELLRYVNQLYISRGKGMREDICSLISDRLIKANPEKQTPIYYSEKIHQHIEKVFSKDIDWINNTFFNKEKKLQIFSKENKYLESTIPEIDPDYFLFLETIMQYTESFKFENSNIQDNNSSNLQPLNINDTRIPDVLRDAAMERENRDLEEAILFMSVAHILRPTGPVIEKKLHEYLTLRTAQNS
ncbi:MAG: hypothetical protein PHW18_02650 [Sulfuricurvum sp.]|uniref:hypothetical protein n=1 Tax=Sulfuricurvum sp. TaxID=2025608 RepID=UPI00260A1691|nr:hypothetical protein [Sulfuricurvum sp.]MDD2828456.1 hypothetical protein [Sulfuricurvum sp.]MDD4949461.1 hypothetical protein [Sulfuricurvum sp.]